jgi:predicted secreted hydrolase
MNLLARLSSPRSDCDECRNRHSRRGRERGDLARKSVARNDTTRRAVSATRLTVAAVFAVLLSTTLHGAELRTQFKPALPGYSYEFPRDHGTHDDYQTEWWYYTGHLESESGKRFGFELTFFRVGVSPTRQTANPWELDNLALAHFALTDVERQEFRFSEKFNRASPYTADAATNRLSVFNESWSATTLPNGSYRLRADHGGDAIDLVLTSRKPPAIHGTNGISVKALGTGYASHYYSLTRLAVSGTVTAKGITARCSGIAWMDHEFGSSALREHQVGWDWFSVQLDNETELMLYIIRKRDGSPDVTSSGSVVLSDGRVLHLERKEFSVKSSRRWRSKKSGATYPLGWRITVPGLGIDLTLKEALPDQELVTTGSTRVTYWEGAVTINGRFGSGAVSGVGYVEMTGYAEAFRAP